MTTQFAFRTSQITTVATGRQFRRIQQHIDSQHRTGRRSCVRRDQQRPFRVHRLRGIEVPNSRLFRRAVNIFPVIARATSVSVSSERTIDAELLEFMRSRSSTTIVGVTDTVEVQARYTVQAIAFDGAEFFLDFASVAAGFGDPGDGLNSPFAVINIAEL